LIEKDIYFTVIFFEGIHFTVTVTFMFTLSLFFLF